MPDSLPAPIRVQVPTDLAYVRPIRKMLEALLYAQGWEEDDVDDAALMITEIVQNAVEHGSTADGRETVDIRLHARADGVELIVEDPGSGQDPREALERDVEKPVPLDEARGRGLFLIHRLAAECELSLGRSGGLRVCARKEVGAS
jgi:anti-sigma regulatory factor (Ser/Thr protein kinase)